MKLRTMLAVLVPAFVVAACASGPQPGDVTTGSILPALPSLSMPSLPSLPSVGSLMPEMSGTATAKPAELVSGNLYRVPGENRRFDKPEQRENYALLRAAEATRWAGGTHFIIINATDQVAAAESGAARTVPGTLIRVLRLDAGSEPPIGAVAADEIIHFFGPTFSRPATDSAAPASRPG